MMLTAVFQEVVLAIVKGAKTHTTVVILKMLLLNAVSIPIVIACSCTLKLHYIEKYLYLLREESIVIEHVF